MSKQLPALRPRQVVETHEKAGFKRWRQKGSHLTLFRHSDGRALSVPVHLSHKVPKGTLRGIIWQPGLLPEECNAPVSGAYVAAGLPCLPENGGIKRRPPETEALPEEFRKLLQQSTRRRGRNWP